MPSALSGIEDAGRALQEEMWPPGHWFHFELLASKLGVVLRLEGRGCSG